MTRDEAYSRVRRHCLAKEGAVEEYPWGDVIWKVRGKICGISNRPAGAAQ